MIRVIRHGRIGIRQVPVVSGAKTAGIVFRISRVYPTRSRGNSSQKDIAVARMARHPHRD